MIIIFYKIFPFHQIVARILSDFYSSARFCRSFANTLLTVFPTSPLSVFFPTSVVDSNVRQKYSTALFLFHVVTAIPSFIFRCLPLRQVVPWNIKQYFSAKFPTPSNLASSHSTVFFSGMCFFFSIPFSILNAKFDIIPLFYPNQSVVKYLICFVL